MPTNGARHSTCDQMGAAGRPTGGTPSLLRNGAHALWQVGDLQDSRKWFDAAFCAAERDGDMHASALAALGLGGLWVHEHRSVAAGTLVELRWRHALSAVPPDSSLAFRLRARIIAEACYRVGESCAILAVVDEARTRGHPIERAEAANLAHHCLLGPEHATLRRELARELTAVSRQTSRRSDHLMGLLWHTVDLILSADPGAAYPLAELRGLLSQQNHVAVGFVVQAIDVMLHLRAGQFDKAELLAAACAEAGNVAGDADATGWYGAHLVATRWYQGRIAELLPMLRQLVNSSTLSAVDNSMVAAMAVAAAHAGDHRQAAGALARLGGPDLASLPRSGSWLASMYGVVEAAYVLRDEEISATAYDLLRPFAQLPMTGSLGVVCFGSVQLALGTASLTIGEVTQAVEHLREAMRANLTLRHRPATAHAWSRLAHALTLRAGPGDLAEAAEALDLAHRESRELGMILPGLDPAQTPLSSGADERQTVVRCRRRGQKWRLEWGDRGVTIENSLGMTYLAALLANPGQEITATHLAAGPGLAQTIAVSGGTRSSQPVLDDAARQAYRQRISMLQAEISQYEARGNLGQARNAKVERDWLINELGVATGLSGRARTFATSDERARIAVGKAIRRALSRVSAVDPLLGAELRATVHTGHRCRYRPTSEQPA